MIDLSNSYNAASWAFRYLLAGILVCPDLKKLPEGISLSADRGIDLQNLQSEHQTYQGQTIQLLTIDYRCIRLITSKAVGDIIVWQAQYFKGHLETDRRCFVAQKGKFYACAKTAKQAARALDFTIMQKKFKKSQIAARVVNRNMVTFNEYRFITGVCESGLRKSLKAFDKAKREEMTIADALAFSKNHYSGDIFAKAIQSHQKSNDPATDASLIQSIH
ncbi:MAG: hypothetical protein U5K75_12030 [Ahrensia sp.]|nr:hypothetical protein [Ahrensia sp.]